MSKKYNQYSLRNLFNKIELELIESMKRNLAKHETLRAKTLDESGVDIGEQWQKIKLDSIQKYRSNNRKILADNEPSVIEIIDDVLTDSYSDEITEQMEIMDAINFDYDKELMQGLMPSDQSVVDVGFFEVNDQKMASIIEEMQGTFRKETGNILRFMDDTYKDVLNETVVELGLGATSINQAIDSATNNFLNKGIDSIVYSNGNRVNIASYAEMYLRTASQRAAFTAQGKVRDELGVYTVIMSQHANSSPMCADYQGTVMIDDVYTSITRDDAVQMARETGYTRLSVAMQNGAFHPNCRHSLSTFFDGKSSKPKQLSDAEKAKVIDNYKIEQQQRKLENEIRKLKRHEVGSVDPKDAKAASNKIKGKQAQLRELVKDNPSIRRNYWRERQDKLPLKLNKNA